MFENGVQASVIPGVSWVKSRHSNADGNCVELAALPDGSVGMRNSRFPHGPALILLRADISAFVADAKEGRFDMLAR